MFIFGAIVGIIIGYVFKPQLEKGAIKVIQYVKKKAEEERNRRSE